jgi:HSF-type DNA-binding
MNKPSQYFSEALNIDTPISNDGLSVNENPKLKSMSEQKAARQRQGGITNVFPIKLFSMLQQLTHNESFSEIIKWSERGDSFIILKPKEFTKFLLPIYFRTTKLSSFQRQLNAYGFSKFNLYACQGDFHVYYHKFFHRDRADHVKLVCRRSGMELSDLTFWDRKQNTIFAGTSDLEDSSCKVEKQTQITTPYYLELNGSGHIQRKFLNLPSDRADRTHGHAIRDLILDQAADEILWDKDANSSSEMDALFKKWNPQSEMLKCDEDVGMVGSESIQESYKVTTELNPHLDMNDDKTIKECAKIEFLQGIEDRVRIWNQNTSLEKEIRDLEDDDSDAISFSSEEWDRNLGLHLKEWSASHDNFSDSNSSNEYRGLDSSLGTADGDTGVARSEG